MKIELHERPVLRDAGEDLVLVRARAEDAEAVAEFNSRIHSDGGFDNPDLPVAAWTRDLLARPHPTVRAEDTTLVVESASGRIVSSMDLISQTWAYEGIPFGVGRPELVGTLPEYRNRGLVRMQFEEVHRWSAARGELLQAITGIPYYYRLFGYEMCVELGGARLGYEDQVPALKDGESEAFTFRPATVADIPFIMEVYAHACRRKLLTCVRDAVIWDYELTGQDPQNVNRLEYRIVQSVSGEPLGYLAHPWYTASHGLVARTFELKPGVSWLAVTPALIRYLWQTSAGYRSSWGKETPRAFFGLRFGTEHPLYALYRQRLTPLRKPYNYFIRVPDLAAFLRLITPVLEAHLAASYLPGYSGECTIGFYRHGLRLEFQDGRVKTIEPWQPEAHNFGKAAFPELTFLQLLFGYRSMAELKDSFADCYTETEETEVLLDTLFPKKPSDILYVS